MSIIRRFQKLKVQLQGTFKLNSVLLADCEYTGQLTECSDVLENLKEQCTSVRGRPGTGC